MSRFTPDGMWYPEEPDSSKIYDTPRGRARPCKSCLRPIYLREHESRKYAECYRCEQISAVLLQSVYARNVRDRVDMSAFNKAFREAVAVLENPKDE
jgi:hypothetical protein